MTWNYRLIKQIDTDGEYFYGIHEVYYNDANEPVSCTVNPVEVAGITEVEVSDILVRMQEALTKPVLDYSMFISVKNVLQGAGLEALDEVMDITDAQSGC
jgi:hypothetical protein